MLMVSSYSMLPDVTLTYIKKKVKIPHGLSTTYSREFVISYLLIFIVLSVIFPEYNWVPWKFNRVPTGFWDDIENHKKFFNWVAKEKNIQKPADWQRVTLDDITQLGGRGLLMSKYDDSTH